MREKKRIVAVFGVPCIESAYIILSGAREGLVRILLPLPIVDAFRLLLVSLFLALIFRFYDVRFFFIIP